MWKAGGRLATGDQERPLKTAISAGRENLPRAGVLDGANVQNLLRVGSPVAPGVVPRANAAPSPSVH
jgi:hypothetical protein